MWNSRVTTPSLFSKWNLLPNELKFHCVSFMNLKTRWNLGSTSRLNRRLVKANSRYSMESGFITKSGQLVFFEWGYVFDHFYYCADYDGLRSLERVEKSIVFLESFLQMTTISKLNLRDYDDDNDNDTNRSPFFSKLKEFILSKKVKIYVESLNVDVRFLRSLSFEIIDCFDKSTLKEIVLLEIGMDDMDVLNCMTEMPLLTIYSSEEQAVPILSIMKMWTAIDGRIGNRCRTDVQEELFSEAEFRDVFGADFRTTTTTDKEENAGLLRTSNETKVVRVSWSSRTIDAIILSADNI